MSCRLCWIEAKGIDAEPRLREVKTVSWDADSVRHLSGALG